MSDKYPYDIGDKIIGEFYPVESNLGGIIDYVDVGELHSLLAKFYEAINPKKGNADEMAI